MSNVEETVFSAAGAYKQCLLQKLASLPRSVPRLGASAANRFGPKSDEPGYLRSVRTSRHVQGVTASR